MNGKQVREGLKEFFLNSKTVEAGEHKGETFVVGIDNERDGKYNAKCCECNLSVFVGGKPYGLYKEGAKALCPKCGLKKMKGIAAKGKDPDVRVFKEDKEKILKKLQKQADDAMPYLGN